MVLAPRRTVPTASEAFYRDHQSVGVMCISRVLGFARTLRFVRTCVSSNEAHDDEYSGGDASSTMCLCLPAEIVYLLFMPTRRR
jgi:hypothetical protein